MGLLLHVLASPFKSQARLEAEIVFLCLPNTMSGSIDNEARPGWAERRADGPSGELAVQLNRSMARRILTQGQKGPEFIVIVGVGLKDPAHMGVPAVYPIRRFR
jgi:hypothetical protein